MPGNVFIKFEDVAPIKGESLQDGHKGADGWIDVDEWSWDVEAETSFLKGGGSAVGKPNPQPLSFTVAYNQSSPAVMTRIVKGTHFPYVTLDMLKQTGTEAPQLYYRKVMKDVFITKVAIKGGEDGSVSQDVEMVFKQVAIGYKRQKNDGTLDKGVQEFHWNVSAMINTSDLGGKLSEKF